MPKELRINSTACLKSLSGIMEKLRTAASDFNLNNEQAHNLELALEEAIVNVCNYAYPSGEEGDLDITVGTDGGSLIVQIIDTGAPFNPMDRADPDIDADIADRPIGGLGIFLIRKLMTEVQYRRENDQNILELIMSI